MAKKKLRVFRKTPNSGFVRRERSFGDKYIQDKKTGRMRGRKSVKGVGDRTGVRRVKKPYIRVLRSKGRRGYVRKRRVRGQIIGKTKMYRK